MNITITPQVTPTFTQIGPLCQNSTAPALPATSNNGITGTWSPATINTATAGTTTYTFTPTDGQCATTAYNGYYGHSTGNTNIYADRSTLSEQYCTSITCIHPIMDITGTWTPATINTATAGTTTYTFTPTAGPVCYC